MPQDSRHSEATGEPETLDSTTESQTIELDPPTAHVLMELLDVALQDSVLVEEPHEYAAFARLMSRIDTPECPEGDLTSGVKQNTVLDGLPGLIYQEALFEHYEHQTGIAPPNAD